MTRRLGLLAGSWLLFALSANPIAAAAQDSRPSSAAAVPATTLLRWFNREDLGRTQWSFRDVDTVGWAQAARAAAELCGTQGVGAGHFNGHQDVNKGTFGVQCSDADVVWRDASAQEISSTEWAFSDVNQVSWAQANRAAERLCATANQGFAGGHFNGHQVADKYGLFCYRGAAKWFDATDAELAATGWGFATPKLDDVLWAQAMRAATGFCQSKGFEGGFMNGHQAPNRYGVVCQSPVKMAQSDPAQSEPSLPEPSADSPRSPSSETVPAEVRASKYRMTLRLVDDTCPFEDYRGTSTAEITPFVGAGFFLPLFSFRSIFDSVVTLQGSPNFATAGGGLTYNGPVQLNAGVVRSDVPAEFHGTLSSDGSRFNANFEVNGACRINGTIEGQRL